MSYVWTVQNLLETPCTYNCNTFVWSYCDNLHNSRLSTPIASESCTIGPNFTPRISLGRFSDKLPISYPIYLQDKHVEPFCSIIFDYCVKFINQNAKKSGWKPTAHKYSPIFYLHSKVISVLGRDTAFYQAQRSSSNSFNLGNGFKVCHSQSFQINGRKDRAQHI